MRKDLARHRHRPGCHTRRALQPRQRIPHLFADLLRGLGRSGTKPLCDDLMFESPEASADTHRLRHGGLCSEQLDRTPPGGGIVTSRELGSTLNTRNQEHPRNSASGNVCRTTAAPTRAKPPSEAEPTCCLTAPALRQPGANHTRRLVCDVSRPLVPTSLTPASGSRIVGYRVPIHGHVSFESLRRKL